MVPGWPQAHSVALPPPVLAQVLVSDFLSSFLTGIRLNYDTKDKDYHSVSLTTWWVTDF